MALWKKWHPEGVVNNFFDFESVQDSQDGLRITLIAEQPYEKLTFIFHGALCLRKADEGDLMKTLSEAKLSEAHSFYIAKKSSLLKWFHEESFDIRKADAIQNYVFVTSNEVIDVLYIGTPEILICRD